MITIKNKLHTSLLGLLLTVANTSCAPDQVKTQQKPIVIISCGRNNAQFYKQHLDSTLFQAYDNYRMIYVDDASPDGTGNLVEAYVKEKNKSNMVTLIKNTTRLGLMANIYQAVHKCKDEEIVMMVEADDQLAHDNVLQIINQAYQDPSIWLTYGNHTALHDNGGSSGSSEVPTWVIESNYFREFLTQSFVTSHLRTFYAWLFKKVKLEDCLHEGKFFPVISDIIKMIPMCEMAGNHILFIPEILYIWNNGNPINEPKTDGFAQLLPTCMNDLKSRKKYAPLDKNPLESDK